MAKQPKATLQNTERRPHSKQRLKGIGLAGGLMDDREHDAVPDGRYLEVVEEMLRQRENNGRDRDD